MSSKELYNKYMEKMNARAELEDKIEQLVEAWENGKILLSTKSIESAVEKGYERLEKLKKEERELHEEYEMQVKLEKKKSENERRIEHYLGERPTNFKDTSKAVRAEDGKMILVVERKSHEELDEDRNNLLSILKDKAKKGEIALSVASTLFEDIKFLYNSYDKEADKEMAQEKKTTVNR